MVKAELIKRSPLRIFEKSIHGGLGKGNVGALASRKGVGKTACLVHIAIDKLLRERSIIHASFSSRTDHIISWYEDIFAEIAKKRSLENAGQVHDEIIKQRVIMNFNQKGICPSETLKSISAMIKHGHFPADCIIIDNYDLALAGPEDTRKIKEFALEEDLEIWLSVSLKGDEPIFNDKGIPGALEEYLATLDVLVSLRYRDDYVNLRVLKDHDNPEIHDMGLMLDTQTLLIAKNV